MSESAPGEPVRCGPFVPYDVEATLSKLRERDYPAVLVEMLRPRR